MTVNQDKIADFLINNFEESSDDVRLKTLQDCGLSPSQAGLLIIKWQLMPAVIKFQTPNSVYVFIAEVLK